MKILLKVLSAGLLLALAACDATNSTSEPATTVKSTPETNTTPELKPPAAEKVEGLNVAFMARTRNLEGMGMNGGDIKPTVPTDVFLVMRLEGVTQEEFAAEERPRIELDGVSIKPAIWKSATDVTRTSYKDGEVDVVRRWELWLLLVFVVPEQAKEVTLVVDNHPPISVALETQISEQISESDIT